MNTLPFILEHRLIAILRGIAPENVLPLAEALYAGGIRIMEITLNSPNAYEVITDLSEKMAGKMLIGAGTVLDSHSAARAVECGARFIISPSFDADVVRTTKELSAISIPGAYTPTEIVTAYRSGADLIKVFPCPDARYLRDVRAPLSHIPMLPTGGVNVDNIREFQKAGASAFGLGSALVDAKRELTDSYLDEIKRKASLLTETINTPI